jgi:hypothetical protein
MLTAVTSMQTIYKKLTSIEKIALVITAIALLIKTCFGLQTYYPDHATFFL